MPQTARPAARRQPVIVLGTIGHDAHIVGGSVVRFALEEAGFKVVFLGAVVPPEEFISLAEDDGLIVPLQRWVLGTATMLAAELLAEGISVQMAVNVSVRHLQAGCLAPDVAHALAAAVDEAGYELVR